MLRSLNTVDAGISAALTILLERREPLQWSACNAVDVPIMKRLGDSHGQAIALAGLLLYLRAGR